MPPLAMSIRWGILGTGGIAREFAEDLLNYTEMTVVAVGSRTLEGAEKFKISISNSDLTAFGSYEELIASDVDAVYVATPHQVHAENTILALTGKRPVLCEKPFAVNADQAKAMASAASNNQQLLVEAMWTRYLPHIQKVRELLPELGDIQLVEADHGQSLLHIKRLTDPIYAGGALLDLGIYPISFAYMVLGKPLSIVARGEFTPSGVDSQTSMIFQYANGAHAQLTTTLLLKSPCTAQIIGTDASLFVDGDFYTPTSMRLKKVSGEVIEFPRDYQGHGLREQAIEFAKLIFEGKKESDVMTHNDTQSIMETMDEIRSQIGLRYPFEN